MAIRPFLFKLERYAHNSDAPDETVMNGVDIETNAFVKLKIDPKSSKRWGCNMGRLSNESDSRKYAPPSSILYIGECDQNDDCYLASYVKVMNRPSQSGKVSVLRAPLSISDKLYELGSGGYKLDANVLDDVVIKANSREEVYDAALKLLDHTQSGREGFGEHRGFLLRIVRPDAVNERNVVRKLFCGHYNLTPEENFEKIFTAKPSGNDSKNAIDKLLSYAESTAFNGRNEATVELVGFHRLPQFFHKKEYAEKQKAQREASFTVVTDGPDGAKKRNAFSENAITVVFNPESNKAYLKDYRRMEMSPRKSIAGLVGAAKGDFKVASDDSDTERVVSRSDNESASNELLQDAPYVDNFPPLPGFDEPSTADFQHFPHDLVSNSQSFDVTVSELVPDLMSELESVVNNRLINLPKPSHGLR